MTEQQQWNMDVSAALWTYNAPQGIDPNLQQVPQYYQQPYYWQPAAHTQRFGPNSPIPNVQTPQVNPYVQQQMQQQPVQQSPQPVVPEEAPQQPAVSEQPKAEEAPKETKVEEEKKDETPIKKEEEVELEKDLKEKEAEKKEEIKEDIKWKDEDYINNIVGSLLEDNTKLEFEQQKSLKQVDFYKEKYEEIRKELNDLKYDERKMTVREDFKPLLKLLEQNLSTPDDKEIEYRLLTMLYDQISQRTKEDYRNNITGYYQSKAQAASKLSQEPSGAWTPMIKGQQRYNPSGIVKQHWGATTRRF